MSFSHHQPTLIAHESINHSEPWFITVVGDSKSLAMVPGWPLFATITHHEWLINQRSLIITNTIDHSSPTLGCIHTIGGNQWSSPFCILATQLTSQKTIKMKPGLLTTTKADHHQLRLTTRCWSRLQSLARRGLTGQPQCTQEPRALRPLAAKHPGPVSVGKHGDLLSWKEVMLVRFNHWSSNGILDYHSEWWVLMISDGWSWLIQKMMKSWVGYWRYMVDDGGFRSRLPSHHRTFPDGVWKTSGWCWHAPVESMLVDVGVQELLKWSKVTTNG